MKIEILYPELCNLYGDRGNMDYLKACLQAEYLETSVTDTPRFPEGDVDLVYLGSMTERSQERILSLLLPYREKIAELAATGRTLFFLTGNAMELCCRVIRKEDGAELQGLGLSNCEAEQIYPKRANSLCLFTLGELAVTGYTSRFSHLKGLQAEEALFTVRRGLGAGPDCPYEGIRLPGILGTYLLGPILPSNPPFAEYLLKLMGVEKPVLAFEAAAREAYERRLAEYQNPATRL